MALACTGMLSFAAKSQIWPKIAKAIRDRAFSGCEKRYCICCPDCNTGYQINR